MLCSAVPAVINIVLDYVFICFSSALGHDRRGAGHEPLRLHIVGARDDPRLLDAAATLRRVPCEDDTEHAPDPPVVGYMYRLGLSTFSAGGHRHDDVHRRDYVFIRYLGEDGVAAFSIACYFFRSSSWSTTPIQAVSPFDFWSYNFGAGKRRARAKALRLALPGGRGAAGLGVLQRLRRCSSPAGSLAVFIDSSCPACAIAVAGASVVRFGIRFSLR